MSKDSIKHTNKPEQIKALEVKEECVLFDFLAEKYPKKNRHNIKTLLTRKQVVVDGKIVTKYDYLLKSGQLVELATERIEREKHYRGISILYEDHHIIVIDKHAGILSIATDTQKDHTAYSMLSAHVKKQNPDNKIFIVHRLDRDTSGVMIFAKTEDIKNTLQKSWDKNILEKNYIAVVEGSVNKEKDTIISYLREGNSLKVYSSQNPQQGLKAITHYTVLKKTPYYSLLKIEIETGRKNQIRVHMEDIGHSIIGDKKYGAKTNPVKRLGLHAQKISFIHPVSKEVLTFETNIPRKFSRLFEGV